MTNYITEKDLWQAIISIKNENILKLYNYMLQLRCNFKVLFPSYGRLAEYFGVCVRTIGRWMTELKELYLITDKKRWLKPSLYQINSMILKFSEKYKQIFPALKNWTISVLDGIYSSNVLHIYNDNINIKEEEKNSAQNSSVFSSLTVKLKAVGGLDDRATFAELLFFNYSSNFERDMDLKKIPINKLTDEEWNDINKSSKEKQKEIRQQKEELLKQLQSQRPIKHLGKKEAHPFFAQFKFPGA